MYQDLLKHVSLGEPIVCGKLTVVPLRWDRTQVQDESECPWLAAREAFEQ